MLGHLFTRKPASLVVVLVSACVSPASRELREPERRSEIDSQTFERLPRASAAARRGPRVELGEPELERALRRRLSDELGSEPANEPPTELADAWRTMTDPFVALDVGNRCGFVGSPTPGFLCAKAFVEAGRFDLLRSILRGPNPEARVFAGHALIEHGPLDAADASAIAIAKLAALPLQLRVCEGCVGGARDWNGALRVLDGRE